MTRYALNTQTGKISRCEASVRTCPHENGEHYNTQAEARSAFESMHSPHDLPLKKSQESSSPTKLGDIMDLDRLNSMIQQKLVNSPKHPKDDSLRILCYSPSTQIRGAWNDVTKQSRGLIVQSSRGDFGDAEVVQRPWAKFYTLSQMENGWHLGDEEEGTESVNDDELETLDFDAPAEVTDKLDGSMLVLYRDPDGNPSVATKGSFGSDAAKLFNKHIERNEHISEAMNTMLNDHSDKTFIFEGVSPKNRIVLKYDNTDIRMIGITKKKNGLYVPLDDYSDVWSKEKGLNRTDPMPAKTLGEALSMKPRDGAEGVVVRIITGDEKTQKQIKIKQDDYILLHRSRTDFGPSVVRDALRKTKISTYDLYDVVRSNDVTKLDAYNSITTGLDPKSDADEIERRKKVLEKSVLGTLKSEVDGLDLAREHEHIDNKKEYVEKIRTLTKDKRALSTALSLYRVSDDDLRASSGARSLNNAAKSVELDTLHDDEV